MPTLRHLGLLAVISLLHACTNLPSQDSAFSPAEEEETVAGHVSGAKNHAPTSAKLPQIDEEETETVAPGNLWTHLRQGFTLLPASYNEPTEEFIRYYAKASRTVQRMVDNSKPYLAYVTAEVEKRGMPLEIALLPMIESHYTPTVYSPQKAAGLWQFIPATGRRYGLKRTWWYDGRRDVVASTNAALDYLETLYNDMDKDWLKALAAYNCGEGRVQNEVKRNLAAGKGSDYWDLDALPRETRNYIPRLLAIAAILKKPRHYGLELPQLETKSALRVVKTGGQIEIDLAARLAGLDSDELRRFNPGHVRWATDPDGPHYLLMPADNARRFGEKAVRLSHAERMPLSKGRSDSVSHRIRKGETLSKIAGRYDISVNLLCQMNSISKRKKLKVGDTLIVPAGNTQIAGAANIDNRKSGKTKSAKTQAGKSKSGKSKSIASTAWHRIRAGDTLWDLAQRYETTVRELRQLNGLSKRSSLRVGHNLKVPARKSQET